MEKKYAPFYMFVLRSKGPYRLKDMSRGAISIQQLRDTLHFR